LIRGALQHLPGIGRQRLKVLQEAGVSDWRQLLGPLSASLAPGGQRYLQLQAAVRDCEQALLNDDLDYLVAALKPLDHWRILGQYFDQASFFDIETTGVAADSQITVIACHHRGQLLSFVKDENLDDFLDLLDDIQLLVSFNGSSFDVPWLLRHFHIPSIPCPHVDLRWSCYHDGLDGGLKKIENQLGIRRPPDLEGVDGAQAVRLWYMWELNGNRQARALLERYCRADVVALRRVAQELLQRQGGLTDLTAAEDVWAELQGAVIPQPAIRDPQAFPQPESPALSVAEQRLQRHWRQRRRS
jgi:uncharacterized protein YprB with RNaseH-like and TPR domain